MKKTILAAIVLTLTASPLLADNASSLCEPKWGTNYRMLEHCIESQNIAEAELGQWYLETGEWDIYEACHAKWTENYTTNFQMVLHCAKSQYEAKQRLQNAGY